jgi:hypothetical protein
MMRVTRDLKMPKTIPIVGLIVVVMTFARIGHAQQVFSGEPGVPGTPLTLPTSATITFSYESAGIEVLPLVIGGGINSDPDGFSDEGDPNYPDGTAFTAVPGDLVFLASPTGGDAPANWAAVINFFNPTDPGGLLGLPATEDQAFFPANAGPGGFAAFQLFPNTVYLTNSVNNLSQEGLIGETFEVVGPAGSFTTGEFDYATLQASNQPVPEPASFSLLTIAGVSLLARRRRPQLNTTVNQ